MLSDGIIVKNGSIVRKPKESEFLPEVLLLHKVVKNMDEVDFRLRWAKRFSKAKIEALNTREIFVHTGINFNVESAKKTHDAGLVYIAHPDLSNNRNLGIVPAEGFPANTPSDSMARFILFMTMVVDAQNSL